MKQLGITACILAVTIGTTAGAQKAPAGSVAAPAVNPNVAQTVARPGTLSSGTSASTGFMATGPYKLDLKAQKKNNQPISASDFVSQTAVARSGNGITITASDGMALTGTVTGNQLHANGTSSTGGTLALTGASAASGSASGTFTAHDGSTTITGTFSMYPGFDTGPNNTAKIRNYGDPKPGTDDGGGNTCGFWCQLKQWFGL